MRDVAPPLDMSGMGSAPWLSSGTGVITFLMG